MKISGTKWYVDIEHNGQIARFGGELGIDGFAAIASSMEWIRHVGPVRDDERLELMRAVREYVNSNKNVDKVFFTDEKYNDLEY